MNLIDLQAKLDCAIPPTPDHQRTHAAQYVHRILGDDCADVLDMLGIGGRL